MGDAPLILALDVATKTGVAEGRVGEKPLSYSVTFTRDGDDHEDAFCRALRWAAERFAVTRFDAVYIEAPMDYGAALGQTNAATSIRLTGLWAVIAAAAKARGFKYRKAKVQTIRVAFLGRGCGHLKGPEAKRRCYDLCQLLGWEPKNRDESDALALWYYAATLEAPHRAQLVTPFMQARVATTIGGVEVDDPTDLLRRFARGGRR